MPVKTEATKEKSISEVFDLLEGLKAVGEATVEKKAELETEVIKSPEPPREMVEAFEPDFVDGYEWKTFGGKPCSFERLWKAFQRRENILLVGPSGCGKSTIAFALMDRANAEVRAANRKIMAENLVKLKAGTPLEELNYEWVSLIRKLNHYSCHEATRSEDLVGALSIVVDELGNRTPMRVDGALKEAWTEGNTFICEEYDLALPGVWGETHQFLDGRTKETMIYINGPEKIYKDDAFGAIFTGNTKGRGENQAEFADTKPMNTAFLNRMTFVVEVGWLKTSVEIGLINKVTGLRKDVCKKMVLAAKQAREAHSEGTVDCAITTRDLKSWARECVDNQEDWGNPSDRDAYWKEVAIPSAYPTVFARIADPNTVKMFERYLSIR